MPHACDGKITTSEMAENMVFLAHSGKVTLREKFVKETRWVPDKPGATPRLSLGYSVASPVFITNELKKAKAAKEDKKENCNKCECNIDEVADVYNYNERDLWFNTVYPESNEVNWFASATTAYWDVLRYMPEDTKKAVKYMSEKLKDINNRYLFVGNREGTMVPVEAVTQYDGYKNYIMPRVKGVYALHQLRLKLGNEMFSKVMNKIHDTYMNKNISTDDVIDLAEEVSGQEVEELIEQWIERDDIPAFVVTATSEKIDASWKVTLKVNQKNDPYNFRTTVKIVSESGNDIKMVDVSGTESLLTFELESKPLSITFNAGNDIPYNYENYFSFRSLYDEYHNALIVYGTSRQIEANNTLAQRFSTKLGDRRLEILIPTKKDSEVTEEELAKHDLIILGGVEDNSVMGRVAEKLGLEFNKNSFSWRGKTYGKANEGLYATFANPFNPEKALYIFNANSAMQLYEMTKQVQRMGVWNIFESDEIVDKGVYSNEELKIEF